MRLRLFKAKYKKIDEIDLIIEQVSDLCFDKNPDTWQIRWFDHEVFDWEAEEYIGEDGDIAGAVMFPDFESFIKLYFYGAFDNAYMAQRDDWGENPEDKSNWVR